MAVLPARLSVLNSMSQSTGLFAKEGDIVTIVNWDSDQLLASVDVADIAQCEGGCVNFTRHSTQFQGPNQTRRDTNTRAYARC